MHTTQRCARATAVARVMWCSLAVVAFVVLPSACSDGAISPVVPDALVASGGDDQTGPAGLALSVALRVTLTGTNGRPFQGAALTWQVASGGGSVSVSSVVTDANGTATTALTLGPLVGVNTVAAAVVGIAPVVFHATAVAGAPARITVDGDGQAALRGTPLPQPIVVDVIDRFDNAVIGAAVAFASRDSGGTVAPAAAFTDASGRAEAVWTLGSTIGSQTITIAVGTVAPVELSATALDPCDPGNAPLYVVGTTVSGSLSPMDCTLADGSFLDLYALRTTAFRSLRVDLLSNAFDAFLGLYDGLGNMIAANDDAEGSLNSVVRILARSGDYFLGANSYAGGETGPYALSALAVPEEIGPCQHDVHVWATGGIQTSQQALATDCVSPSGATYDHVFLVLHPGQSVTIAMNSTAFDAALQLWDLSSAPDLLVAGDDNGGGGTDALLTFTASGSYATTYAIWALTSAAGDTGAYTLSISSPTTAAQAPVNTLQGPGRSWERVGSPSGIKPSVKRLASAGPAPREAP